MERLKLKYLYRYLGGKEAPKEVNNLLVADLLLLPYFWAGWHISLCPHFKTRDRLLSLLWTALIGTIEGIIENRIHGSNAIVTIFCLVGLGISWCHKYPMPRNPKK